MFFVCFYAPGIQQKGSILLQALVAEQKSIDNVPVARQVAKALVTAMKKFRSDPNVLAEVRLSSAKPCVVPQKTPFV